jgi:hypothetical protein
MMIFHHEKVEEGCFVYQVIRSDRVRIKSYPEMDDAEDGDFADDGGNFEENELLAVDLVQPASHATFLRLADQSGWVVADEKGEVYMRQIPVETGLFSFFVDNIPSGVVVRRHPMDDTSDLLTSETENRFKLQPMQRIYCDAVTEHPITGVKFYRLQCGGKGAPATPGWVYDRKPAVTDNEHDIHMLLDASKVKTGMFAYRAVHGAVIRHRPNCSEASKTANAVLEGEIVVVDLVRESPYDNGNGPFLRLADGSGWLFEKKLGEKAMESVPIESGKWVFSILNEPVGVKLRKQPADCQDKVFSTVYEYGELVECDRKITNSTGVNFYRVHGTVGWLFDQRGGIPMLNLLSTEESDASDHDNVVQLPAWEPNFVRGIAATVDGVIELSHQTNGQILTFDNADTIQVKVFCTTRTVCTIFEHSSKGTVKYFLRNCTPQDVHNVLRMDLIESIIAYDLFESERETVREAKEEEEKKEGCTSVEVRRSPLTQQEETLRIRLLVCETEIATAQAKRRDLLAAIKVFDNKRAETAAWMMEEVERHQVKVPGGYERPPKHMTKAVVKPKYTLAHKHHIVKSGTSNSLVEKSYRSSRSYSVGSSGSSSSTSSGTQEEPRRLAKSHAVVAAAAAASTSPSKRAHVCGECFRSFSGKYSRDIHCFEVHKIFCGTCDKIFPSFKDLQMHRDAANHW